jgi:hypothetical protein
MYGLSNLMAKYKERERSVTLLKFARVHLLVLLTRLSCKLRYGEKVRLETGVMEF